jgi:hypothetical protein
MIERNFIQRSFNRYQLGIKLDIGEDKGDSVVARSFEITKAENFIIQKDVLELLTGEIANEKGSRSKYVALNDPHDIDESLTGLCLITMPNYQQLKLDCEHKAQNLRCKSGVAYFKVVTKTRYLFFKDCFCQADCKQ